MKELPKKTARKGAQREQWLSLGGWGYISCNLPCSMPPRPPLPHFRFLTCYFRLLSILQYYDLPHPSQPLHTSSMIGTHAADDLVVWIPQTHSQRLQKCITASASIYVRVTELTLTNDSDNIPQNKPLLGENFHVCMREYWRDPPPLLPLLSWRLKCVWSVYLIPERSKAPDGAEQLCGDSRLTTVFFHTVVARPTKLFSRDSFKNL